MNKKIKFGYLVLVTTLTVLIGGAQLFCNLTDVASAIECCPDQEMANAKHHEETATPHHEEGAESHPSRNAPENCCKNWVFFVRGGSESPENHIEQLSSDGIGAIADQTGIFTNLAHISLETNYSFLSKSRAPDLPLFLLNHTYRI